LNARIEGGVVTPSRPARRAAEPPPPTLIRQVFEPSDFDYAPEVMEQEQRLREQVEQQQKRS
jgi:hypothetical protein